MKLIRFIRMCSTLKFYIAILYLFTAQIMARPTNIGYSGAPGTPGRCASACHGTTGGTIFISGFPASYVPGQSYLIRIRYSAGAAIANFNASVRIGTSSTIAGTITAGLNTETYSTSSEPNGVHFTSPQKDSGNFTWNAPAVGVGDVKLYLGGLQGTSNITGQNTSITLTSTQSSNITEQSADLYRNLSLQITPTISNGYFYLQASIPGQGSAKLKILRMDGMVVNTIQTNNSQQILWQCTNKNRTPLEIGVYFACLEWNGKQLMKKFIINN